MEDDKNKLKPILRLIDGHTSKTRKALERRGIDPSPPFAPELRVSGNTSDDKRKNTGQEPKLAAYGGLTRKQDGFARSVGLDGTTFAEAYRRNYNTENMQPNTIHTRAFELSRQSAIADRITHYVRQRTGTASHNPEKIRAFILQTLQDVIQDKDARHGDRLKAVELLGKVDFVGIFKERSVVETNTVQTPEEIQQKIEELLKTGTSD